MKGKAKKEWMGRNEERVDKENSENEQRNVTQKYAEELSGQESELREMRRPAIGKGSKQIESRGGGVMDHCHDPNKYIPCLEKRGGRYCDTSYRLCGRRMA